MPNMKVQLDLVKENLSLSDNIENNFKKILLDGLILNSMFKILTSIFIIELFEHTENETKDKLVFNIHTTQTELFELNNGEAYKTLYDYVNKNLQFQFEIEIYLVTVNPFQLK